MDGKLYSYYPKGVIVVEIIVEINMLPAPKAEVSVVNIDRFFLIFLNNEC